MHEHLRKLFMQTLLLGWVVFGGGLPSLECSQVREGIIESLAFFSGGGLQILGSDFGRTDFSRIFIFGPPDFFADFLAGFFLLIFLGKSAQRNPPGKSPAKSSKIYTTKIPDTFLQRGRANKSLFPP